MRSWAPLFDDDDDNDDEGTNLTMYNIKTTG